MVSQVSTHHVFYRIARIVLPRRVKNVIKDALAGVRRRRSPVPWCNLRRVEPVSRSFGYDRGTPVDRYYIERFLDRHRADIRGRVLEIANSDYTGRFGGDQVATADVLHYVQGNPEATLVGDLTTGDGIPTGVYDCIIITETLPFIYEVRQAVRTMYRLLRPGGVALVTAAGIAQISRDDMDQWGQYWRFTSLSARRLFEEVFPAPNVQVNTDGNVLAAVALLQGISTQELSPKELDHFDADYEVTITVRAQKPHEPTAQADSDRLEPADSRSHSRFV